MVPLFSSSLSFHKSLPSRSLFFLSSQKSKNKPIIIKCFIASTLTLFIIIKYHNLIIHSFMQQVLNSNIQRKMDILADLPYDIGVECLTRVPYQDFSSVTSVCKSWKQQIELQEFWARRKSSGLSRKVIVLVQAQVNPAHQHGLKRLATPVFGLTVFEPESGYWAKLPPIPGEYSGGLPLFCRIVGAGRNLVLVGGWSSETWEVLNVVFIYNFVSATWRRGANMPGCRRTFFACASDSDGTVFVAGGHDCEKRALKSAMMYDVDKDKWTLLDDMERERDECKGVFLRGKFHVIGGYDTVAQGAFATSADVFDLATPRWLPTEENLLECATCPRHCTDDGDERLYMCRDANLVMMQGSTWQVVGELPRGIRHVGSVTAWKGKVLVIGSEGFGSHQAYIMDLESKKWEEVDAQDGFYGHVPSGCCLEI